MIKQTNLLWICRTNSYWHLIKMAIKKNYRALKSKWLQNADVISVTVRPIIIGCFGCFVFLFFLSIEYKCDSLPHRTRAACIIGGLSLPWSGPSRNEQCIPRKVSLHELLCCSQSYRPSWRSLDIPCEVRFGGRYVPGKSNVHGNVRLKKTIYLILL